MMSIFRAIIDFAMLMAGVLLAGCSAAPFLRQAIVTNYEPSNVFREAPSLPAAVKRIAVLPLTTLTEDAAMDSGSEALWPILLDELRRSRRFELVLISVEELRTLSGRAVWSGEEKFPLDFFEKLRERAGVHAVLFSRLTQYRAYEPLAVGWRLKLLEAEEPRILWSVDEVFDARVPAVAAAARHHAQNHPESQASLQDSMGVLLSPRRFGRYTACAIVETLPGHERK